MLLLLLLLLLLIFSCSMWLCRGVVLLLSSSLCVVVYSCLFISEVKFVDLLEIELPRKLLPLMFSSIKDEGWGITDFKVPSSS